MRARGRTRSPPALTQTDGCATTGGIDLDPAHASAGQLVVEVSAINGISVVDEVFGVPIPGSRLQELVPDPRSGRTGGDVEVDQLAPLVTDQEEDVEGSQASDLHRRASLVMVLF